MPDVIEPANLDGTLRAPARPTVRASAAMLTAVFGGVIGLSAFLLFSVEPLIGRVVLPVFGGTPAVWATVLFFFQGVLLLGYLYGHLSVTRLGIGRGAVVHVGLAVVAFVALLAAPTQVGDLRTDSIPEVLNLIGMLALVIGLPAFVLTTTTPLLSAWFAALSRDRGTDAYWLYALSNTGSLLALLAYPFLIEPRIGLVAQRGVWTWAFAGFVALIVGCAWWTASARRDRPAPAAASADELPDAPAADPVTWPRRATWLLLAAVPSGLLSAVTNFIATDLVSAPLLWLAPLSIYLITFIVAFSPRGRRLIPYVALAAPAAITLLWVPYGSAGGWPILPLVLLEYGGLAIVATTLHGRLAEDRPASSHLTEFYLVISVGGALASAFVAIVSPAIFPGVWEYPILLVLALVALAITHKRVVPVRSAAKPRPKVNLAPFFAGAPTRVGPYLVVAGVLAALLLTNPGLGTEAGIRWLLVGGVVLLVGARPGFLAVATGLVLALAVLVLQPAAVFRDRSFFGVTEVLRPAGAPHTTLMNGTTVHGVQSTDPAKAGMPTAYYAPSGPFGDVFDELSADATVQSIAITGLGAGALTTYQQPGWTMTYFEIDPLVADVASDPRYFTYLSSANPRPEIVLGDARLSLRDVPTGAYDAMFLDAFSSDAIPTHLLTTEAMAEYVRVVRPGGLIVVHISNRYYDLAAPVAAAARESGLVALERLYVPGATAEEEGAWPSRLVVASADGAQVAAFRARGWTPIESSEEPMTDDYMDVLRFLRLGGL